MVPTDATVAKLRAVFEDILEKVPDNFSLESEPEDFENWDSARHATLLLEIERQFSIEFAPEEFGELVSVGGIANAVQRKLATTTAG